MKFNHPKIDSVVLLGGGKLLVKILNEIERDDLKIKIITSPRHAREIIEEKCLLDLINEKNIPSLIVNSLDDLKIKKFLENLNSSLFLSISSAWIFSKKVIESLFNNRIINVHGTRLPQNRGGGNFSWRILMGNRLGFTQLHIVDSGIDTGDLVATQEYLYPPTCRRPIDFEDFSIAKDKQFILEFIRKLSTQAIEIDLKSQTSYLSSYWPRLSTSLHGWIDWNDKIIPLERFICAFDEPFAGAKTTLNGENVSLKDVLVDFSDQSCTYILHNLNREMNEVNRVQIFFYP